MSVIAMVSLPSGFTAAGGEVAGTAVGAGAPPDDDPLLGGLLAGSAVGSAEEPQATATTSIVAVSTAIRNGIRKNRCLAMVPPPSFYESLPA